MKSNIHKISGAVLMLLALAMLPLACGEDHSPKISECVEDGIEDCACFGNGTCNPGLRCNQQTETCEQCPDGELSCGCYANDTCNDGFICASGRCVDEGCTEDGVEGCACDDGNCEVGTKCENDVCVSCSSPGGSGCVCDATVGCMDGLTCEGGVCIDCTGEEGCACNSSGLCNDGFTCGDASTCVPCSAGNPGCACTSDGRCEQGLFCEQQSCVSCAPDYLGEEGCACENGSCADGLRCDEFDVCEVCPPGADGCACDGGGCDGGLRCNASNVCETCAPGTLDCPCDSGQCSDGSVCDSSSSQCRAPRPCEDIGCADNQKCQPSTSGLDARCLQECKPGYAWNTTTNACDAIPGANCNGDATDPDSISAACDNLSRGCQTTATGAECGACLQGYVETQTQCVAVQSCSDLNCSSLNRSCVPATQTDNARCGDCVVGYVEDASTGQCRRPLRCTDITCTGNESCVEGSANEDARCASEECAPNALSVCTAAGETGLAYPVKDQFGNCICETEAGYFISSSVSGSALPCDKDQDGWIIRTAYASINSQDPAVADNARCELRTVDRIELQNELGQRKVIALPNAIGLYESAVNDDPAPGVSYGSHRLEGKELNSFTKGCVGAVDDLNGNKIADVDEGQTSQLPASFSGSTGIRSLFQTYAQFSYFFELHRSWYVPPGPSDSHGMYVIREKQRGNLPDSGDGIAMSYDASLGDYWQVCRRWADSEFDWNTVSHRTGLDFWAHTPYQGEQGWTGMTHHSQFKCVKVISQSEYDSRTDPSKDTPQEVKPSVLGDPNDNRFADLNVCQATSDTNGPVAGVQNPEEPVVSCTLKQPAEGDIGWAAIRYIDHNRTEPHYSRVQQDDGYVRGCVNECADYICPGPFDDPYGAMSGQPPGDFGRCYTLCGHNTASAYGSIDPTRGPGLYSPSGASTDYALRGEVPVGATSRVEMTGTDSSGNNYTIK